MVLDGIRQGSHVTQDHGRNDIDVLADATEYLSGVRASEDHLGPIHVGLEVQLVLGVIIVKDLTRHNVLKKVLGRTANLTRRRFAGMGVTAMIARHHAVAQDLGLGAALARPEEGIG